MVTALSFTSLCSALGAPFASALAQQKGIRETTLHSLLARIKESGSTGDGSVPPPTGGGGENGGGLAPSAVPTPGKPARAGSARSDRRRTAAGAGLASGVGTMESVGMDGTASSRGSSDNQDQDRARFAASSAR